jgi:acyl carrier protein
MNGEQKLKQCFISAFGASANKPAQMEFGASAWDSVAHIALVTELETAYSVELTPEDITDLTSYSKAREILGRHGVVFDGK